jgi:hypothetical protein
MLLLLLCAVMVNSPYHTLREYNYAIGDENRVSGITWGSNNEVEPAGETLRRYKSNWLRHVTRKNNDWMPKKCSIIRQMEGNDLKKLLDEAETGLSRPNS